MYSEVEKYHEVTQSCPTLCNPMGSSLHQAPLSVGFSRQEYWSGLPFPFPENLQYFPPFELCRAALKVKMKVAQSCLTLCDPHGLYSPWNSPGQNTGASSCSLLQGVFPTQGSNPGLSDCRPILYQLSHQGSPGGAQ